MSGERTIRSAWLHALAAHRLIDDEATFAEVVEQVLDDGDLSPAADQALRSINWHDVLDWRRNLPARTRADVWLRVFATSPEIVDEDTLAVALAEASAIEANEDALDAIRSITWDAVTAHRAELAVRELTAQ